MSRATKILAGTTVLGFATSIYLYVDNSSLREEVSDKTQVIEKVESERTVAANDEAATKARDGKIAFNSAAAPTLPDAPKESRLDRRVRRTEEFEAMFGRLDGETEEQWRARVAPFIAAGLMRTRLRTNEFRRVAEEKAKVTPEQAKAIDDALLKTYDDVMDYANKSVKDGVLSPYERNVAGWLDFAGGLGGVLHEAQGKVGGILRPEQLKAMSDAGFEWGEYIGAQVRWEDIAAPPPRK
jgi:hypothetical protein